MTELRFYGDRPPGIDDQSLPGRLVVIEGTDGVGRSTQVALLKEWLEDRGYAVLDTGLARSVLTDRLTVTPDSMSEIAAFLSWRIL